MQSNNYIGQIAFEQVEQLRKEQQNDKTKGEFDIKKAQTVKGYLDSLINLEKHRLQVATFNKSRRIEINTYDYQATLLENKPDPRQITCSKDVPKSVDFVCAQVEQFKRTLPGDNPKRMPQAGELKDAGYSELIKLIDDEFGGFKRVAEILGLEYQN